MRGTRKTGQLRLWSLKPSLGFQGSRAVHSVCSVWLLSLSRSKRAEAETPEKHGHARTVPAPAFCTPYLHTYLGLDCNRHTCLRAQRVGAQETELIQLICLIVVVTCTIHYIRKCNDLVEMSKPKSTGLTIFPVGSQVHGTAPRLLCVHRLQPNKALRMQTHHQASTFNINQHQHPAG